jgi:DNA-directed RNA polymerase specialized sigma24 family protein
MGEIKSLVNIATVNSKASYQLLSDKELADLYKSSANQDLLATLYTRYSDLLFGVCMKYLKDADAAADASADIYVELVGKMLKHEVQNVKAWLHTVARNHCLMKMRGDKKMPTDEFPDHLMQTEDDWHPDIAIQREKS